MTLQKRSIKSFVLRQGKITTGQKNAIDNYYSLYGIDIIDSNHIDLNKVFNRNNSKVIEIGFGMGDASWQIARNNPDVDYVAFEVHSPGVGSLLMKIVENNINNIKIIQNDAKVVLANNIQDQTISGFHVFFPDPWHKKRHNKRRLLQNEFIQLLLKKLKFGGYLHIATDWQDYAEDVLDILNNISELVNISEDRKYLPRPDFRPLTKFEERGIKLGHKVFDLYFIKK
jgi:tRNA (guanine-N7-)-methyltransferase